ncbi:hypothetical protein [Pararhizobium sp. PWRC1-1]|uniref:hypothetical protein n=1 Tax=Pararhizobium sp. PWRC1-1 TaxID=2804566 RepID=UPI003CF59C23
MVNALTCRLSGDENDGKPRTYFPDRIGQLAPIHATGQTDIDQQEIDRLVTSDKLQGAGGISSFDDDVTEISNCSQTNLIRTSSSTRRIVKLRSGLTDQGRLSSFGLYQENASHNLAVNARGAMPDGCNLKFKTANECLDQSQAESHLAAD